MSSKPRKISPIQRNFQLNIGLIIGFILLIYVLFHLFTYFTAKNVAVYEVTAGTINQNHKYTALALRQETVVNADADGQLYFYESENSQVGTKSLIYSVDGTGDINKMLRESESSVTDLSQDMKSAMIDSISTYISAYDHSSYSRVYNFKDGLSSQLSSAYNTKAISDHADDIASAQANDTFHLYYPSLPGLLSYHIDGLEGTTTENFTSESMDAGKLNVTNLKEQTEITAGSPIYKLITSQYWNLVMEIDDKMVEELKDTSTMEITFDKDGRSAWSTVSLLNKTGRNYLVLSLDDSMERYADLRYLTIELDIDHTTGLKIPNSTITSKKFFTIPKTYFLQGADSKDQGVMVKRNDTTEFVAPTIYNEDDTYYYIDNEFLSADDVIIKPKSTETYTVGTAIKKLKGVYSVNKGYAIFKQIDILYQNSDYAIIASGTNYGISMYDRIALQGDSVKENDIVK